MVDERLSGPSRSVHDVFDVVLPYRFLPRPPSGYTVVRKDLLRHLTEASLLKQLSIVRGPAGSGKTTLLSQWRDVGQQMDRPVAWLTIDATDRDPAHFVAGLADALEDAGCPVSARGFRATLSGIADRPPLRSAQMLASIACQSDERPVIALDQYQEMDGPVAGEILSGFLAHAPTARIVIATRIRPGIPLGSLRARDQLFEIGPSDLNLTPLETRAVFDDDVPELYTRRLYSDTSGEAVAVGFARRVIDQLPRDMISLENWQEQLHEYYRAEVLDILPVELREAMSRLVVVERFDLSLATALIGRNATEMIERLHHIEGLLLRHRGTQEFYFSEMLRRFLERRFAWLEDDEHVLLHQRAAAWFADRGRNPEALRHAVAARDRDRALALLERIGYPNLVAQQGVSAAHRLLDAIGVTTDPDSVSSILSFAMIHAHEGEVDKANACLEEARRCMEAEPQAHSGMDGQSILASAFVAGLHDETLHAETAPALNDYLATLSDHEHEVRAQAQILLSWDRFCHGDLTGAEALASMAVEEYAETEAVYGCLFVHVHRTLARFWRNNLDGALEEIVLAERMARIFFPEDQRLRAMTGALRAGLLFEVGRPDPLADFTALVGTVGAVESWSEIQIWSHVQGARAAMAQRRASEARGILAYGLEVARRFEAPRLAWNMKLAAIDISLRQGEPARALEEGMALGIVDAAFLQDDIPYLTWQERIGGVLMAARLAEADGRLDNAWQLASQARTMIAATSAARFEVQLEIICARLANRGGDAAAAEAHVAAGRSICEGTLPVRLFLDVGEDRYAPEPDAAGWTASSAHASGPMPGSSARIGSQDPLTARERQILLFMGEGHPNKVTAHRLGLSEATVKFHLRNIYRKLHAQNRTQALARYRTLADIR